MTTLFLGTYNYKYYVLQNAYQKHKEVVAAQGVKIIAKELDHALAGLPMHVAKKPDEVDVYKV